MGLALGRLTYQVTMSRMKEAILDAAYQKAYEDCPEDTTLAQAAASLFAKLLPEEDWGS